MLLPARPFVRGIGPIDSEHFVQVSPDASVLRDTLKYHTLWGQRHSDPRNRFPWPPTKETLLELISHPGFGLAPETLRMFSFEEYQEMLDGNTFSAGRLVVPLADGSVNTTAIVSNLTLHTKIKVSHYKSSQLLPIQYIQDEFAKMGLLGELEKERSVFALRLSPPFAARITLQCSGKMQLQDVSSPFAAYMTAECIAQRLSQISLYKEGGARISLTTPSIATIITRCDIPKVIHPPDQVLSKMVAKTRPPKRGRAPSSNERPPEFKTIHIPLADNPECKFTFNVSSGASVTTVNVKASHLVEAYHQFFKEYCFVDQITENHEAEEGDIMFLI